MAALVLVLLLARPAFANDLAPAAAAPDLPIDFGGPFALSDQHGNRVTEADFAGRYLLLYFGYTSCPDICPAGLQELAVVLASLGEDAAKLTVAFVTVDPARDTPALLRDYLPLFDPDIVGLTGTEAEIAAVARAWRVHRVKVPIEGPADTDYLVSHSSITFLMGPDGNFVTLFPHGTPGTTMAERIAVHLDRQSTAAEGF